MSSSTRLRRKWTEQEDQALRVEAHSQVDQGALKDWHRIAAKLPGRTNKDCRKRWSKICDSVKKGVWDSAEDKRLEAAVERFGFRWTQVAQMVGTRHGDQCAKRWQHFLDPNLDRSKWTAEDDERLVGAVDKYGRNWKTITSIAFPGRSPTNVKNRSAIMDRRRQSASRQQTPSQRKTTNAQVDSEDDSDDSASEENDSSEEHFEPASIDSVNYSGNHSLLDMPSDIPSSSVLQLRSPNTAVTTIAGQDLNATNLKHIDPTFDFDSLDTSIAPGPLSPFSWPSEVRCLDTPWQASTAPMDIPRDPELDSQDLMDSTSDHWKLAETVPTLKTVLTLEDIQPETLSKVLDVLVKSRTKVKMETHQ